MPALTMIDLLGQWAAIELDLHEFFGVDVESGILRERTWRWLSLRIRDLWQDPVMRQRSRLGRALNPIPNAS